MLVAERLFAAYSDKLFSINEAAVLFGVTRKAMAVKLRANSCAVSVGMYRLAEPIVHRFKEKACRRLALLSQPSRP